MLVLPTLWGGPISRASRSFLCCFKPLSSFTPQCSKLLFSKSGQRGMNAERFLKFPGAFVAWILTFKPVCSLIRGNKCGLAVDLVLVRMPSIILSVQEFNVPWIWADNMAYALPHCIFTLPSQSSAGFVQWDILGLPSTLKCSHWSPER